MNARHPPLFSAPSVPSSTSVPTPPLIDDAFLADPYPAYRALREAGPIHWREDFFGGAWVLTRHADVEAALRDPRLSAQRTGGWVTDVDAGRELAGFQRLFARAMLFLDAPDHTRIRQVLNVGFKPSVLQSLKPRIEAMVTARLDAIDTSRPFDFMQALARPLPAQVIAALMEMDGSANEGKDEGGDDAAFIEGSHDLAAFIGAPRPTLALARRAQVALLRMNASFEALAPKRRLAPGDDLVSRLVQAEAAGQIESGPELMAQCAMLLFAGHETTRNLLGNGLHALLSDDGAPGADGVTGADGASRADGASWARLQREPERLPNAIRELLRFDSPVQYSGRRVAAAMTLHGQPLRRGDLVVTLIGAANRDPARHIDPDRLDIARQSPGLLSFGSGPHVCIGAALTLMEAEIVFRQLLDRWPTLRLVDATPDWNGNAVYRGLSTLAVTVD